MFLNAMCASEETSWGNLGGFSVKMDFLFDINWQEGKRVAEFFFVCPLKECIVFVEVVSLGRMLLFVIWIFENIFSVTMW